MRRTTTRRNFIKSTVSTGVSLALLPNVSYGEMRPAMEDEKSRVVEVFAPKVVKRYTPDAKRLKKMVNQGILKLTGKSDPVSAWKCFVTPDDCVGIKLNSWGGRLISSKKWICEAVVEGVKNAGVPDERIVIWDQITDNLLKYAKRQNIRFEDGGVLLRGCMPILTNEHYKDELPPEGFDTDPVEFPWGKVKLAELVANELTVIINLPVIKDHSTAGVSGALKNISHAVVDKPWHCHDNYCDPYIADIVSIPSLKNKLRLHILDGILGVAAGGPELKSLNHLLMNERLLLSTDPVAVDSIGYQWVVDARKKKGFPPLEERENPVPGMKGKPAGYIATAAKRGLGNNKPEHIELIKLKLPEEDV